MIAAGSWSTTLNVLSFPFSKSSTSVRSPSLKNHRPQGAESLFVCVGGGGAVVDNNSSYTCIESLANTRRSGLSKPITEQSTICYQGAEQRSARNLRFGTPLLPKCSPIGHKHWLQALCGICQHGKVTFVGNYEISTIGNNSGCHYERKRKSNLLQKSQNKDDFYDCTHIWIYIHIRPLLCK